jgi:hypothetical protein
MPDQEQYQGMRLQAIARTCIDHGSTRTNYADIKIYTALNQTTSTRISTSSCTTTSNYVKIIVEFYIAYKNINKVLHQCGLPPPPIKTLLTP